MARINIRDISKSYNTNSKSKNDSITVFEDFSLDIKDNEFITLFGPNGCGKSTLLNILSGLIKPDYGKVTINDKEPQEVKIGYVFQNYQDSLLPWRTNLRNITLPLELKGFKKEYYLDEANKLLNILNITIPKNGYPYQLSGGYQQLIALMRALISNPDVLLMDEPFNQLDFENRTFLNDKLLEIWRKTKITTIFVSHEIDEAILLGTKTVVLSKRPCRILKSIEVELPENRSHKNLETSEFFELKKKVLSIFEKAIN